MFSREGSIADIIIAVSDGYYSFSHVMLPSIQGPPDTGKTTSILCLARTLVGITYHEAVLHPMINKELCEIT